MAGGDLADAAEAAGAGFDVGLQHGVHFFALPEIGVADDARGNPGFQTPAIRLGGDPCHEFRLPYWLHLLRPRGAIRPETLKENRRHHVVAGGQIPHQIIQQIRVAAVVPQMMMRIDDGQLRLQDVLGQPGQPGWVGKGVAQNQFWRVGHVC